MEAVPSPCTGVCRLDANRICIGCGRTAGEIGEWLAAGDLRRVAIRQAAGARLKDLHSSQRMVSE